MTDYGQIFDDSYQRVIHNSGYNAGFVDRFYEIFFTKSPRVAELFQGTNMVAQKTMLHDSLLYMIEFARTRRIGDHVRHVGQRHSEKDLDIPDNLYDLWLDSLVEAVAEQDPDFDDRVALAWRVTLAPGIAYMKYVHRRPELTA